jgi:hypothetical protein
MTDRSIFNRRYTSFNSGTQEVYLVNGAGVVTSLSSSAAFVAGETLVQGAAVYVSGLKVFNASALSGIASFNYGAFGVTGAAAVTNSGVSVIFDDAVTVSSANITAETSLVPGQPYYLSKFPGQITRYSTASGVVTNSGTNQYQALVLVGTALSAAELEVEIDAPVVLYQ